MNPQQQQQQVIDDGSTPLPPFKCPDWASLPISNVYLEVCKNGSIIDTIDISKERYYVFGRNSDVSSILLDHPSVSRRHAAIVYHGENNRFYLIDLLSATGTFVNNQAIKANTPTSIKEGFVMNFGNSSKQFILKGTVNTTTPPQQQQNRNEPKQIKCRHLLVKHRGSRNPHSWREENITRSKEDAIHILSEYREKIVNKKSKFEDLAQKYSDCSSYKRGGMLDPFGRGVNQKSFEDAAFALEVGQISGIIDTASGVHIIERLQ
eukprot:gene2049-2524_t